MSCYHPLTGLVFGKKPDGKLNLRVVGHDYDGKDSTCVDDVKKIPIPCGKCIGCRLDYSRRWADRMLAEASLYDSNLFLTLTYDDEHLPPKRDGSPVHSLSKRDLQLFLKRLRYHLPDQNIRYFAAGEYGPQNMRPHYHMILFNTCLDDMKFLKQSSLNDPYFVSELIDDCWQSKGFHMIGNANWDTMAYTARYVVKKQKGASSDVYTNYNFEPEFCIMSRKPGIGRDWFEEHKEELYAYGSYQFASRDGARSVKPNRYYDSLFDIEYPDVMEDIKNTRLDLITGYNKVRSNISGLNYQDQLLSDETNKLARVSILNQRKEL